MILSTFFENFCISSYEIDTSSGAVRFIYVIKVTDISKLEDRWGVKARKNALAKTMKGEETKGNTMILKGTGFILHLRTFGTFDVTLCLWIVKVMLFVNGRLKRAFAKIRRSLLINNRIDRHVNTYNCILIKAAETSRIRENSFSILKKQYFGKRKNLIMEKKLNSTFWEIKEVRLLNCVFINQYTSLSINTIFLQNNWFF